MSVIFFRLEIELALKPDARPNEVFGTQPDFWLPAMPLATSYKKEALLRDPWVQWVLQDKPVKE